jgi:hypothetical protein
MSVPFHVEMTQLCSRNSTYLGVLVMVCIILAVLLHITNHFVNSKKPKTSKKPLLGLGGNLFIVLAVLGIAVYIILPLVAGALGIGAGDPCNPPTVPPYCGEYCQNSSVPKPSNNCTCLMY